MNLLAVNNMDQAAPVAVVTCCVEGKHADTSCHRSTNVRYRGDVNGVLRDDVSARIDLLNTIGALLAQLKALGAQDPGFTVAAAPEFDEIAVLVRGDYATARAAVDAFVEKDAERVLDGDRTRVSVGVDLFLG